MRDEGGEAIWEDIIRRGPATPDQSGYNLHQYTGWTGVFTGNIRVVMAVANGYVGRGQ